MQESVALLVPPLSVNTESHCMPARERLFVEFSHSSDLIKVGTEYPKNVFSVDCREPGNWGMLVTDQTLYIRDGSRNMELSYTYIAFNQTNHDKKTLYIVWCVEGSSLLFLK